MANPKIIPNPGMATMSATSAGCFSTGGDFTITFADARTGVNQQTGVLEEIVVEVARMRLNTAGFLTLYAAMEKAKQFHEALWGAIPRAEELSKAAKDANAAQAEWFVPPSPPPAE